MTDISVDEIAESISKMTFDHPEWPMKKVRSAFIDYFVKTRGHKFWPSSPCVPHDDPTLLFANAGMNQYKPLFLGTADPNLEISTLKRACNTQKCIRAGGKHNDLDDVGKDVYHHTFFEMMGNWSFGDYFKEEAIEWAWACLIDVYGLDKERLYATYFGGNDQTPPDHEARDIWLKYLPASRVLPFDAADNFWEMGATGPCGPCVEIHYDRIGGRDAASLVNADLPSVIEIWNNVFIQYNREADSSLRKLPAQHVDTGMGFERLASILQGKDSNYDTDVFTPLFEAIRLVTGARPYGGKVGTDDEGYVDMAYRVVADHVRTLTFAITDGAVPSNDGRGYVLRRVLRRAVRYGRQNLGAKLGFFSKLVPTLVEHMGEAFPEIVRKKDFVIQNLKLDVEGFERKMQEEKDLSAAARKAKMSGGSGKEMVLEAEQTAALIARGIETTVDDQKYVWEKDIETVVKACFVGRNETEDKTGFKDSITKEDGACGLILSATNFYAEQGGQIYDTGTIKCPTGTLRVDCVQVYGGYVLHLG
ncbi:hypothetical protein TrRE_jg12376, partial [Triparma retinervis]